MSLPYTWIGPLTEYQQPGSPKWNNQRDWQGCTIEYRGPYDLLVASMPAWGVALAGLPPDLLTGECTCINEEANVGLLIVNLARILAGVPPRYRRDREEIQKRIETHPRYAAASGQPGAFYECTAEMMMWLQQVLADEKATTPSATFPDGTTDPYWAIFSANYTHTPPSAYVPGTQVFHPVYYMALVLGQPALVELFNKIKKGEDSYIIGLPTVEAEIRYNSDPGSTQIYTVSAPPGGSNYPTGYIWMLVRDPAEQEGNYPIWTQRQKWIGLDWVDTDLYD